MLSRRELSRAELTAKLIDRGFTREAVDAAVERLAGQPFVDDRRAAFAHVRTASRLKGRGQLRIQRELEARGFSRELDPRGARRDFRRTRISTPSSASSNERAEPSTTRLPAGAGCSISS